MIKSFDGVGAIFSSYVSFVVGSSTCIEVVVLAMLLVELLEHAWMLIEFLLVFRFSRCCL